jgi:Fe-Mn family superoxide dismutase
LTAFLFTGEDMSNSDGNHEVVPMPVAYEKVSSVMDEETYKWHHDTHYAGYVNKRNEIEKELKTVDPGKANANYSAYRALKLEETWNANGAILHELYWGTMGGDGKAADDLDVVKKIKEDFGSLDAWKSDFVACGKASRGWTVLMLDMTNMKTRNILFDLHNVGGIFGAAPILVLDVYEHAYYHKFGPDRASYIQAFLNNVDWKAVDKMFSYVKGFITDADWKKK